MVCANYPDAHNSEKVLTNKAIIIARIIIQRMRIGIGTMTLRHTRMRLVGERRLFSFLATPSEGQFMTANRGFHKSISLVASLLRRAGEPLGHCYLGCWLCSFSLTTIMYHVCSAVNLPQTTVRLSSTSKVKYVRTPATAKGAPMAVFKVPSTPQVVHGIGH